MNQEFDFFGQPELPYLILCNPDKSELFSLYLAYETKLNKRFNALSEFSFLFVKSIDGGQTTVEAYDYLKNKRLVFVEGYGYFQITNASEDLTGAVPIMSVECKALEAELIQKRVSNFGGTMPLWNILSPENSLLWRMIQLAPTWAVGNVSAELLTKFRTFNVSDTNIYNLLVNEVANAFEAIFVFDTVNKTINAYSIPEATSETDIFLSFDNVISNASFSEISDEISTSLSVFGNGNLNINLVNPLGTSRIYDFSYYANTTWMSQGLVDAITAWDALVDSKQVEYADNLTLLSTYNAELLVLQATLATLNSELLTLEGVKGTGIRQGDSLVAINAEIATKQAEIDSQEILITNKEIQINDVTTDLQAINTEVSFDENFTPSQLLELNTFIYENTYQNPNIVLSDLMTPVEIQAQAQTLYDQSKNVLGRVSQPRYEIGLELVNYIALQDFSVFTDQTDVGSIVTCELKDGTYIETVLLEIEMQFDDPSNFSMTFSNRLRLDNGNFTYSDLIGQVVRTGSDVSFDSIKWANWENLYKNDVTTFITSALDATVNNLISNSNQDILINQNGLRARQSDGSGGYSGKQVWLVNNMLAFSSDGFTTAKLALGEITLPSGGTGYGLVADTIIGRIIAGNTLTISNGANNFVLDETGATLNNAKFNIQTTNTNIIIDPTATISFRIQKNEGGTFNDKFWVDNTGNVNFSGNLAGATGTFSGSLSAATGTFSGALSGATGTFSGALVAATGTFSGNLSGASGTFSGDIYANRLIGAVSYSQLTDIPADKITSGTMSGSRIYGGTISSGSGYIYSSGGNMFMNASNGASGVGVGTSGNVVFSGYGIFTGAMEVNGNLYIDGGLVVNGSNGLSTSRSVSTPSGTRIMTFVRGILTGFT